MKRARHPSATVTDPDPIPDDPLKAALRHHEREARRIRAEIAGKPKGQHGGPRPASRAPRPGSGPRPTRLSPEETSTALDALLLPGEIDAWLATRLGVKKQAVSRARKQGATRATLDAWKKKAAGE